MYGRKLSDRTIAFGHEGVLYRNSFVMYDRKTKSLWVHTTGECVKGELKGRQLTFLPSVITTWGHWKKQHPKSLVLDRAKRRGFMGTFGLTKETAVRYGISVGQGKSAKLYPVAELRKRPVLMDRFDGEDLVIFFDPESLHATAWVRGKLTFAWKDGKIVDGKGREWDRMLGRPVGKKGAEDALDPRPATAWLIHRWKGFYPKAPVYEAPK